MDEIFKTLINCWEIFLALYICFMFILIFVVIIKDAYESYKISKEYEKRNRDVL